MVKAGGNTAELQPLLPVVERQGRLLPNQTAERIVHAHLHGLCIGEALQLHAPIGGVGEEVEGRTVVQAQQGRRVGGRYAELGAVGYKNHAFHDLIHRRNRCPDVQQGVGSATVKHPESRTVWTRTVHRIT